MTKATIVPGPCNHTTTVYADSDDGMTAEIKVETDCKMVQKLMQEIGPELNAYEVCMNRSHKNPLYELSAEKAPLHAACPVITGITKCIEAECGLALPRNVSITIEKA